MNNSINISCINETNTRIFALPANKRQDYDDFSWDDISLIWSLVQFTLTDI